MLTARSGHCASGFLGQTTTEWKTSRPTRAFCARSRLTSPGKGVTTSLMCRCPRTFREFAISWTAQQGIPTSHPMRYLRRSRLAWVHPLPARWRCTSSLAAPAQRGRPVLERCGNVPDEVGVAYIPKSGSNLDLSLDSARHGALNYNDVALVPPGSKWTLAWT